LWIPPKFPYITFNKEYDFSHVSLYGFYRFIGAMLSTGFNIIQRLLEDKSFCTEIIKQIKKVNDYFPFDIKATREYIWPMNILKL